MDKIRSQKFLNTNIKAEVEKSLRNALLTQEELALGKEFWSLNFQDAEINQYITMPT